MANAGPEHEWQPVLHNAWADLHPMALASIWRSAERYGSREKMRPSILRKIGPDFGQEIVIAACGVVETKRNEIKAKSAR
jgi:hypothetical protein